MTRLWTYIFAAVSLALLAAIILLGVYVPGLHRDLEEERAEAARLSVVAVKILPPVTEDVRISAEYLPQDNEQAVVNSFVGSSEYQASVVYRFETNAQAQQQLSEALLAALPEVDPDGQSVGSLVEGDYRYVVVATPAETALTVTIYELSETTYE